MISLVIRIFGAIFLIIAPFLLLVRGAVYVHASQGTNAWISVLVSAGLTAMLIFVYLSFIRGRLTRKKRTTSGMKVRFILSLIFVFGFAFQGLMYISAENVKQSSLQKEFRQLHPILRLGVSTILIIDRKAIMTDAQRVPEDYRKMGLTKKQNSLHYKQNDGFVYAVDLRTSGRSAVRNWLLKTYFNAMGFQTLRHVGTADHLHVSLQNPDRPWAR
jgi:hypothetical protein